MAEASWQEARSDLVDALNAVEQVGSAEAAAAARELEATIPASAEDARRREFKDAQLQGAICRALKAGGCEIYTTFG